MTIRTGADIQRLREQGALTSAEETLIANCRAGKPTKLGQDVPDGPNYARTIRADLLRFLITGGCADCPTHDFGVDLTGAYVTGTLDLSFATARGLTGLFDCRFESRIEALQARFGFLNLTRSHLQGLIAQGAQMTGGAFLRESTVKGKVSFAGAGICGQLDCDGAHLENLEGDAFNAQGAQVKGDVFLRKVTAKGKVSLSGAKIAGQLSCNGAQLENLEGDAFNAEGSRVTGSVVLEKLTAEGEVILSGAEIGGQLSLDGARFEAAGGEALTLQSTRVDEGFLWRKVKGVRGLVDLSGARVSDLVDDTASWEKVERLYLNGFRYETIHGPMNARMRLDWVAKDAAMIGEFRPQPYEQLARVYKSMGHQADWRRVLIEKETLQRADERKRMVGFWGSVWWPLKASADFLLWLVVGYGYRPFRVVVVLLVLWLIGGVMAHQAWQAGDFAPNSDVILSTPEWRALAADGSGVDNPAEAWSAKYGAGRDWETFHPAAYAFDVVVPIVTIGQTEAWAPSTTRGPWGWHLWWVRWGLTVAGWIVTAVGAAAITGIIRRE
ncbi:MAG: hypothetical protein LC667_07945 [Thioalkalivibrio sp.]|nr:hypothetical protein [Thioalkalivibrio sp.]